MQNLKHLFSRFLNLKMKSMLFEDSVFEECYFEDITSTHTIFRNCTFIASLFYNTGKHIHIASDIFCGQEQSRCPPKLMDLTPSV